MSKRQDATMMMQVRDRRHEISPESYAYYMSRRGGSSYGRETERSAVDGSREYGLQLNGGRSGGRLRSRSPRWYHQGTRMDDVIDVEIVHRRRRSPPPLELRERYEPAEGTISPNLKGFCKYGNPTLEGGGDEYFTVDRARVVVSDEIDTVQNPTTVEDRGMVRPHHHIQHASNYGETSSHFLSGSASQIVDSRVQYVNHLSVDRSRNLDAYNALNIDAYNEQGKRPLSLRDTSYPVNNYANVTPALRTGGCIPPCCQGIQHMHSDDLHKKRSEVAEKSLFRAYEAHPSHHSILDHQTNVRDSMTKLKSTHGLICHLNYHPPTIEEGVNGDGKVGYLSDGGCKDEHSGSGQAYRQKTSGNIKEADRFLSDEDCEHLRLHSRRDCYSAHLSSNLLNEIEDNYTSNHSPKDFRLSRRLSHERYIRPDPQSCCTLKENFLHGGAAYDHKGPHFVTSSEYDPESSGTWVDDYHKHAAKTNFTDSRADSMCHTEEDVDKLMRTSYWSSSDSKKQAGEEYYNARSTLSSPEPREEYVDSEMYNPEIRRDMKQCGQCIDMPSQERERVDGKDKYRGSHMEWIDTEVGSVYDVNITSKYDMVVGGLDSSKQRWTEEGPNVCGAPSGMLKMKYVTFKRTNKHNLGVGTSHGRCNTNSSRYLSGRDDILSEERMIIHPPERIGSDSNRHAGSRSIFDRLGSPRCSNYQFSPRRLQGHMSDFVSRKHEHRQTKGHTKSNHRTLNGSPHLNKGNPRYERLKSSKTNTNDSHMKHMEDMETLEDVDIPGNPASGDNTEDFKQSVQKAFLLISQKMNENPATRRRYRGQGKAGTLFCIVCKKRSVNLVLSKSITGLIICRGNPVIALI
uniref:Uncharacterized protein n=1 Tax=Kalanchoe fedtschenkoi TaxID=63787 RepID=A0A7N0RHN5_KALFE